MPRLMKTKKDNNSNDANLGFWAQLFLAADKMRVSMDASEYISGDIRIPDAEKFVEVA